jgi:hypothetical protein
MRVPSRFLLTIGLLVCSGLAISLLAFYGCGTSGPSASGVVRLDGQLLPTGWIKFIPQAGTSGPDAGAVIDEGQYRIEKGLQVGEYRVEIQGTRKNPRKKVRDAFSFDSRLVPEEVAVVPSEYNQNSRLTRRVDSGTNTFNFDLEESKGKQAKTGK